MATQITTAADAEITTHGATGVAPATVATAAAPVAAHRTVPEPARKPAGPVLRSFVFGLFASSGLLLFYLGTVTLLQDWGHALAQLGEDWPFIAVLVAGFGVQVGLLTYIRASSAHARKAGVAASTGASGIAMLACCAHHLTDVLPVLGLSAAATLLGAYRTPLLWLSVVVNSGGVIYLVRQLRKATRLPHSCTTTVRKVRL